MMHPDRLNDDEQHQDLQRRYGGRYVARRGGEAIAISETFDELMDTVEGMTAQERTGLVIELIEPADRACVY